MIIIIILHILNVQTPISNYITYYEYPISNLQCPISVYQFWLWDSHAQYPSRFTVLCNTDVHISYMLRVQKYTCTTCVVYYMCRTCVLHMFYTCNTPHMPLYVKHEYFVAYYSERQWVLMIETSILNVFIKIRHHFVKINLQSPTESYQLITFAICRRTGSGWKQQLSLKVWSIEHAKTLQ